MPSPWSSFFDQLFSHYGMMGLLVVVLAIPIGLFAWVIFQFIGLLKRYVHQADLQQQAGLEALQGHKEMANIVKTRSEAEMVVLTQLATLHAQQTEVLRTVSVDLRSLSDSIHRADEQRGRDLVTVLQTITTTWTPRKD